VRDSWKKLGDLLPEAYDTVEVAAEVDFDPTGKFGRYMDRRLKRFVTRYQRRWPTLHLGSPDREHLNLPSRQDTNSQE
jgi:hypothetical protein